MTIPLTPGEKTSLKIQRSSAFWKEPKELLLTLFACSLASLTQGWDQAANGNLGWPSDFGLNVDINHPNRRDTWIFGGINSIMWFSAAILGSYLSDPISEHIGRRGALFVAAICSFSSVIAASQTQSWQGLMGCRIILGLGIGGKASVVPILESEVTPSSKRGRLLVGWQVFVAAGLLCGYTASYILRDNWRHQVLSGAVPAFALLVFTWASCESPRWLIIQGKYDKAFTTLVRLRKERVLAAKELCSIYYQIQAERWLFSGKRNVDEEEESEEANPFMPELERTSYFRRLINHYTFPRIRRAAIAAMVVMLSQQLSGINIIALLATTFFTTGDLRISTPSEAQIDSYKLAIGFGAANTIFSIIAYFLVENKEEQGTETEIGTDPGDDRSEADNLSQEGLPEIDGGQINLSNGNDRRPSSLTVTPHRLSAIDAHVRFEQDDNSSSEVADAKSIKPISQHLEYPKSPSEMSSIASDPDNNDSQSENDTLYEFESSSRQLRGRRFLLLVSLAGGMFTLLITSLCFNIHQSSPARLPLIALFIYVFTLFYSVGAGAIPFLYCAEVCTLLLVTHPHAPSGLHNLRFPYITHLSGPHTLSTSLHTSTQRLTLFRTRYSPTKVAKSACRGPPSGTSPAPASSPSSSPSASTGATASSSASSPASTPWPSSSSGSSSPPRTRPPRWRTCPTSSAASCASTPRRRRSASCLGVRSAALERSG